MVYPPKPSTTIFTGSSGFKISTRALIRSSTRHVRSRSRANTKRPLNTIPRLSNLSPSLRLLITTVAIPIITKGILILAIQDYDKALEIDPRYADAYSNRGNAYKASGNLALAIQEYNRSLELDPNIAETYYNRGNAYRDIGDLALAIQDYSRVIELDQGPTATYAYYVRAISWLRLSEWERAKPDLVAARSVGIQLAKALASIGYEGVNDFEHKNGIELPGDIVEMLTG